MADSAPVRVRWFALVQLVAHLGLLAIGCFASWTWGGGWWVGAAAAGAFAVAYATVWALLLAPGSRRRLAYRGRLIAMLASGAVVLALAAHAGIWLTAVIALSVAILGDSLDQR